MKRDVWEATRPAELVNDLAGDDRSPLLDAKVMMVDDEPLMTELVQTHLEEQGYCNFVATNDPRQALALLRSEHPAVLLLDLMMPGVNGFEVLEAIRADRALRYTPVIVLTASCSASSKLQALQLGATDFLAKPVDASELVLRVRNTLAFQQYHQRMIHYDTVTGLPRESLFEEAVDAMIAQRPPGAGVLAMLSITVPECRTAREGLDRHVAEALATVIAVRLQNFAGHPGQGAPISASTLRHPGIARLDEQNFALVLDGLEHLPAVEARARQVLAALAEPVRLGMHELAPAPRIGVSTLPADGHDAANLRRSADLAASHALAHSGAPLAFASPDLNSRSFERLTLGAQLRSAVTRGELLMHYQPKMDLRSGRIDGMEALVRWQHPTRGPVPPGQFIPLAEELGLMGPIGDWVIRRACLDLAQLRQEGWPALSVSVNVSKPQITEGRLESVITSALADAGVPPDALVVELTESLLMDDVEQCLELMHRLKSLGVQLSIDDFGTGYSSLAYLKKFPIDELKVDRSFVKDLPGETRDRALVATIIDLGHALGMSVTAEGIETEAQRQALSSLDCDVGQGFLFSRPVPIEALRQRLREAPAA